MINKLILSDKNRLNLLLVLFSTIQALEEAIESRQIEKEELEEIETIKAAAQNVLLEVKDQMPAAYNQFVEVMVIDDLKLNSGES